jgi:hypothetical protein
MVRPIPAFGIEAGDIVEIDWSQSPPLLLTRALPLDALRQIEHSDAVVEVDLPGAPHLAIVR